MNILNEIVNILVFWMDPAEEDIPTDSVPKEYEERREQAFDEMGKEMAQKHEVRRYTRVKGMGKIIHKFEPKYLKWLDDEKKCQMLEVLLTDQQAVQFFLACYPNYPSIVFYYLTAVDIEHLNAYEGMSCDACMTDGKHVVRCRDQDYNQCGDICTECFTKVEEVRKWFKQEYHKMELTEAEYHNMH